MTPTTTTLTTNEAAAAGAVLGGMFGIFGVMAIAFFILMIVAMWKIFTKAGEKGWKALIPIYNLYIYFKIAGAKNWFWALFVVSLGFDILSAVVSNSGVFVIDQAGKVTAVANVAAANIFYFVTCAVIIFQIIAGIVQCAKLSKAFKRGIGTTLGLIFLPNIFQLILAFGSAKYDKKAMSSKN